MENQMSIFDYIQPEYPDINTITEAEMVSIIGKATGLTFVRDKFLEDWRAKYKGCVISIEYLNYKTYDERNGKRFISVEVEYKTSGIGSPCDNIEEAIGRIKKGIERFVK